MVIYIGTPTAASHEFTSRQTGTRDRRDWRSHCPTDHTKTAIRHADSVSAVPANLGSSGLPGSVEDLGLEASDDLPAIVSFAHNRSSRVCDASSSNAGLGQHAPSLLFALVANGISHRKCIQAKGHDECTKDGLTHSLRRSNMK